MYLKEKKDCINCRHCVEICPLSLSVPDLLRSDKEDLKAKKEAARCIVCGRCERVCPQRLKVRVLLADIRYGN